MPRGKATQGGGVSKRAKKDPNAPKKAASAYMCWLAENRARLTKPGMGVTDVAKAAGAEWREMTSEDKAPWDKAAQKDKERYEKEMAKYKGQ